ncbi:hypothetical protein GCM10023323_47060 [Streptomyces thinghirensis]|uniref:Uncharacterized protein n=1 Tax=Streptomyces thinghirensis TaxID=551547 RepID=A0ABP9T9L6_9ACTN
MPPPPTRAAPGGTSQAVQALGEARLPAAVREAAYGEKGTCRGVSARSGWRVNGRHFRGQPIPRRSEDGHPPARPRPTTNKPRYAHPHRTPHRPPQALAYEWPPTPHPPPMPSLSD